MSDPRESTGDEPVAPTTEFGAVTPDPGAQHGASATGAPPAAATPAADATIDQPRTGGPVAGDAPDPVASALGSAGTDDPPPAWKTPPASGLPPQWGAPDAEPGDGAQRDKQATNLWGLVPEDRPEVLLGVALAGGVLAAILLRSLVRR